MLNKAPHSRSSEKAYRNLDGSQECYHQYHHIRCHIAHPKCACTSRMSHVATTGNAQIDRGGVNNCIAAVHRERVTKLQLAGFDASHHQNPY